MSIVQASLSWFKQTFSWSNSWESWQERIVAAALLLVVIGLWYISAQVELLTNVLLWSAWVVAAAVLMRRGWLMLFGPVLFYDMIRTSRRNRYFLLRCLYAAFLLFILFMVWANVQWSSLTPRQEAAQIAMNYFTWFVVVQFIMVLVLTPAYVAGSISEEKDRKTLEFLLATDLRNREIVLSKLGSRLANLLLFLLTGLPILSFLQFLGGVDPDLVLASFAATAVTALGLASLSILQSVVLKRPRDSITVTYLIVIAYYVLSLTLSGLKFSGHWFFTLPLTFVESEYTVGWLIDVLSMGNVMLILFRDIAVAATAGTLSTVLPSLLWDYSLFYLVLSAFCIGWSIYRLRSLALKQTYGKVEKLRWYQRFRPPVGSMPVLWKELNVEGGLRINWMGWIVVILLVLLSLGIGVFIIVHFLWEILVNPQGWHGEFFEVMNVWVRIAATGVACLTLLGVAVRASTTIRSEIDRDTFDALVTTPLSSDAILLAKFAGSLFSVRLGWLWLGSILTLGVLTGGLHLVALPLFLGAWFIYASFFAMVGLWFSMVSKSMMRATVYTMLTTIGFGVGHWFLTAFCCFMPMALVRMHDADIPAYLFKFQTGMTPPAVLFLFAYPSWSVAWEFGRDEYREMIGFCLLGLFLWTMACVMMWFVMISPRFRMMTRRDQTSGDDE